MTVQTKPQVACPWCSYPSEPPDDDPDRPDGALDASCCARCMRWAILENGVLRKPSMIETLALETEPEARRLRTQLRLNKMMDGTEGRVSQEVLNDITKHTTERVSAILRDSAQLMTDPRDGLTVMIRVTDFLALQAVANLALFTGIDNPHDLLETICLAIMAGADKPLAKQAVAEALKIRAQAKAAAKAKKEAEG